MSSNAVIFMLLSSVAYCIVVGRSGRLIRWLRIETRPARILLKEGAIHEESFFR